MRCRNFTVLRRGCQFQTRRLMTRTYPISRQLNKRLLTGGVEAEEGAAAAGAAGAAGGHQGQGGGGGGEGRQEKKELTLATPVKTKHEHEDFFVGCGSNDCLTCGFQGGSGGRGGLGKSKKKKKEKRGRRASGELD